MNSISRLSELIIVILLIQSCKEKPTLPSVSTTEVTDISTSSATSGGEVTNEGGDAVISRGICWNTSADPTISNSKTIESGGLGTFTSNITSLTPNTIYYVRAYGTNIAGTGYGKQIQFITLSDISGQTGKVNDIDGNIYSTIGIGGQCWMAENLKSTKYNDGTAIPNITDNTAWEALLTGAYSDYNNTPANSTNFGRLYNWFAVDNDATTKMASNGGKNLCPTGWHVPSDAEWTTLTTYLGGFIVAGGKLKETGTTHWLSPNTGATNETGFTALPGGYRNGPGAYYDFGNHGIWWSSTKYSTQNVWHRIMNYDDATFHRLYYYKQLGLSVRCVKDN
jgi:uncharacterized protein (TIGR02145 family)